MDSGYQLVQAAVLQKDSRGSGFHRLDDSRIGHARCDHENARVAQMALQFRNQAGSLLLAKIVIEQDYVGWRLGMRSNSLAYSPALTHHEEAGIGVKKPAQALPKEAMVVHHQDANWAHGWSSPECDAGVRLTTKQAPSGIGR